MKAKKLRRIIATLTAAVMTVSAIPYSALAVEGDNSGTGDWNGIEAEGSTWDIDHQGYRLCIVTEDGTPVTNAVDILYSNGHNLPDFNETKQFLTSRSGGNRDGYYYWTDLGLTPLLCRTASLKKYRYLLNGRKLYSMIKKLS